MYEIITLEEIRDWLKIPSGETGDDAFFELLRDSVTKMFERYTSKQFITRQYVEYQDGRFSQSVNTRRYPIYKVVELWDDLDRDFDDTNFQIDSDDFVVDHNQGQISLYNDETRFSDGSQNVKIDYWAGYSRFHVIDEVNNYIDITDTGGTSAIEISENTDEQTSWEGYSAEDLASTLQTALNADGTLNATYTVSYHHGTQKFTISATETFTIEWNDGASAAKDIGDLMGFDTSANDSGASSYTADNAVTGVPDDIFMAANITVKHLWQKRRKSREDLSREIIDVGNVRGSGGTQAYITEPLLPEVKMILNNYTRVYL